MRTLIAILMLSLASAAQATEAIHWQPWSKDVFAQAQAQHRFVLLDLEAVWCHWCHVMDQETYADPKVAGLLGKSYIAVKVDQDSDPDLSNRYGDYGWPATIVFAADGSEIVKRQGYMPPGQMAGLLQAIIDDPSPGPSVRSEVPVQASKHAALDDAQRKVLIQSYLDGYDHQYGGWGNLDKFIDPDAMDYALLKARAGDAAYQGMAQQTLDAARALIDPVWGGVDQYSTSADWKTPHYEKLMQIQANYLRVYSEAYAQWHRPTDLAAAKAVRSYIDTFLKSPSGTFYVSQDADLSPQVDGSHYYALDDTARRKLAIPQVDTHVYARENGWAIRALVAFHDATGDASALNEAETAAQAMLASRALPGGGFSHGVKDAAGPYLGDSLAMAEAFTDLYRATGERQWLKDAGATLDFIQAHFADSRRGGYVTAQAGADARGVLAQAARLPDENQGVVRVAGLVQAYTSQTRYRSMAGHAMRYLAAPALSNGQFMPGVLLADIESSSPPLHVTVVGHKDDVAAEALHAATLALPMDYKQVDWWDKREGALPDPEVSYPELPKAAAFICTGNTCSSPIFDPARLAPTLQRLLAASGSY
jgi:uncharacterized protein YyaL (SSP411 family)